MSPTIPRRGNRPAVVLHRLGATEPHRVEPLKICRQIESSLSWHGYQRLSPTPVDNSRTKAHPRPGCQSPATSRTRHRNLGDFFRSTAGAQCFSLSQHVFRVRWRVVPRDIRSRCTPGKRVSTAEFMLSTRPVDNGLHETPIDGVRFCTAGRRRPARSVRAADPGSSVEPSRRPARVHSCSSRLCRSQALRWAAAGSNDIDVIQPVTVAEGLSSCLRPAGREQRSES